MLNVRPTGIYCWNCTACLLDYSLACGTCGMQTAPEFPAKQIEKPVRPSLKRAA